MQTIEMNKRTGLMLRILLVVLSFFIFWSLLAIASAIWQPIPMPAAPQTSSPPGSLADSTLREILRIYFSPFPISILAIFILAGILGYRWSKAISIHFFEQQTAKSMFPALIKRLFAPNAPLQIEISDTDSEEVIFGPSTIQLDGEKALLTVDGQGTYQVKVSHNQSLFPLNKRERLMKIIDIEDREISFDTRGTEWEDVSKSIDLTYRLDWSEIAKTANRPTIAFFFDMDSQQKYDLIEKIMQLEFRKSMKKVLDDEMNSQSLSVQNTKEPESGINKVHSHSNYIPERPRMNPFNLRNRKRRIYPPGSFEEEYGDQSQKEKEKIMRLNDLMEKYSFQLDQVTAQLFGRNILQIVNYYLGDQK